MTRPVVLGQGSASDEKCARLSYGRNEHPAGEVIGVYSAQVDLAPELAAWRANVWTRVWMGAGAIGLMIVLVIAMLRITAINPLRTLTQATEKLAGGNLDVQIGNSDRRDELGIMARALEVFRDNLRRNKALETEAGEAR